MDVARRIWRHVPESLRKPFMPARNALSHDSFQPDREGRRYFEVFANDRTAGIRVNLAGREARGMVQPGVEYEAVCDQLLVDLHALRNAETGEPLIREVLRTRDHYRGPYLDLLPDLLVTWNRSSPINAAASAKIGVVDSRGIAMRRTGDHRIIGRFFATGPGWSRRRLDRKVRVEDFAPTIAALLDVPLEKTDGRVIDALMPETVRRRQRDAVVNAAFEAHP
jgi:predicted AlkP superfamily phosphohydrolase/phosphomutase